MEAVTPIPKIRAGNDFVYVWAIERNGVAVDLTAATTVRLSYGVGKPCNYYTEIPFEIIDGNKVRSSHNYENTGTYNLRLEFTMAGVDSTVDIDAFAIVPRSSLASEATDFAVTSDMAIGFKGEPFTYDDFTPEQIAELQQPATDAIASIQEVELAVETAEGLRVQAEQSRQSNTATAIQNAENATDDANEKAGLANDAALLANEKAGLAETATTQANAARDGANSAATNANNVANTYAAELAAKELKDNKQNSLEVDGTGTKFPTVDAVNEGLADTAGSLLAEYTYTGNKEVVVTSLDIATGIFTSINHGLADNSMIVPTTNQNVNELPYQVFPAGLNGGQYNHYIVKLIDADRFAIKKATADANVATYTSVGDLTKWHFETDLQRGFTITNLKNFKRLKVRLSLKSNDGIFIYLTPNGLSVTENVWYLSGGVSNISASLASKIGNYTSAIEVNFSFDKISTIQYIISALNVSSATPNSVTNVSNNITLTSFKDFSALTFNSIELLLNARFILNGTKIRIYKVD